MPQKTYYSVSSTGRQAKRHYVNAKAIYNRDNTTYSICNPTTCNIGPYRYRFTNSKGDYYGLAYRNATFTQACCYTHTGESITCPWAMWSPN